MKQNNVRNVFFSSFLVIAVFISILIISASKLIINFINNLPSIQQLENYNPNLSTKIYDKNDNLIGEFFIEKRTFTKIEDIPNDLKNAFIAVEDNDFFKHWGISLKSIVRAFFSMLLTGKIIGGGSTITQQLIKIIFLTQEKTLTRKLKEFFLTIQLEKEYSKYEILEFYINQIYFGNGTYGVQAASELYFNKNVKDLNLAECATLSAIPKSPNYYNPLKNEEASFKRKNFVLSKMKKLGYITKKQKKNAEQIKFLTKDISNKKQKGRYFTEFLKIILEPKYGINALFKGGFSIYTTLDIKAQIAAEKVIEDELIKFDENKLHFFKKKAINPVKVQCALLAIDPKNGAIRAMVGGRDFKKSQFNRAIQAKRQAGSIFKLFVYLAAIENGFTPSTILKDEPMIFLYKKNSWDLISRNINDIETIMKSVTKKDLIGTKKIWIPKNFGNKYRGNVTLETAFASSINTCAIEVIMKVTPEKVIQIAKKFGITTHLINSLSLALGSNDITLQEIVSAFAILASNGIKTTPYIITKIIDKNGKVLEQISHDQREIISPQICFIMTNMLRAVIERGSGKYAKNLGRPCAGKTGTTNNSSDVWFVGYTPQLVAGVWVGYDDSSISLGSSATGGLIACPIWTNFMKETLKEKPILNFQEPKDIEICTN
ncbi:MAG: penicillin-binding protein 1A [Endomicrobium sp.]|jgi:penicillin-binding protein 1A|nr:penicillin-binding protein 1A [Endomicrobium sp.]